MPVTTGDRQRQERGKPRLNSTDKSRSHRERRPEKPVGVVLAGAGARGAYEAGMLSVLLPVLDEQDRRPTIFTGTSAGAINAVLFASLAHLPGQEAAEKALAAWRKMHRSMVLRPAWQTVPAAAPRYLARLLGVPVELCGLLDTRPLLASLRSPELLDWPQLHDNVRSGVVDVVSVVTTELGTNRTKVFFETATADRSKEPVFSDLHRAIDYPPTVLTADHVLASAAIPALFPPVNLGTGQDSSWHMDGGVRLNTPLKPALHLGARALVIIATDPPYYLTSLHDHARRPAPTIQDALDEVLHGYFSDQMIGDLWNLIRSNKTLSSLKRSEVANEDGTRTRQVPFVFGGPQVSGELSGIAAEALGECLQGVRRLRNFDLSALSLLLGSGPLSRADLISYVFFEPEFIDAAIAQGQADAEAIVQQKPFWRTEL